MAALNDILSAMMMPTTAGPGEAPAESTPILPAMHQNISAIHGFVDRIEKFTRQL